MTRLRNSQPIAGGRRIIAAIEGQEGQREARPIDLHVTIVTPRRISQQFQDKFFCRCGNYHRAKSSDALRFSSCSRKVLGRNFGGSVMAPQSDTSSLYVLVCSMAGTIVGLAATWIVVAHTFVQPMVA